MLDGLGLARFFDPVVGGDSPFGRKPNPAGLRHIIETAGASPATTIMVGDSPVDRQTARNAGTAVCLVRYGFGFSFGPVISMGRRRSSMNRSIVVGDG